MKNSHNAGAKSYARWGEDIVSNSYSWKSFSLFFLFHISVLFVLQRQADPEKKRPHRAKVYLATHKKKDNATNKDKNERLVGS